MEIKVLGPGCVQCDGLERSVMEAMAELDLAGDLEHVRDVKEIGTYGVMGTPALIINGTVKAVGRVPPKERIKRWLEEAVE
ncbi:MAG: thioredoxin family protein [Deltaproteobacteria bacterium]|nr:thioredoxin family protein [Deltaproteobacteria bacterium]